MLVFGTEIHIVTFLISLFEMVFFCYQVVYYLSRPTDKNRLYYLILLYLLIQYNILSGLFPDKNISINIILQSIISYSATFAMAMYFPYYFYKVFDLSKLKFYVYWGSVVFLLIPLIACFVIPYCITGNLELSRRMVTVIPFFYALSFLYSLISAIKAKSKETQTSKKEVRSRF